MAEYNHGLGLRTLAEQHLPGPGSHRGYTLAVFIDALVLLLQAGGRTLEALRALQREAALRSLLDHDVLPDPDPVGDWLLRMGDPQTGQAGLVGLGCVCFNPRPRAGGDGSLPDLKVSLRRLCRLAKYR